MRITAIKLIVKDEELTPVPVDDSDIDLAVGYARIFVLGFTFSMESQVQYLMLDHSCSLPHPFQLTV